MEFCISICSSFWPGGGQTKEYFSVLSNCNPFSHVFHLFQKLFFFFQQGLHFLGITYILIRFCCNTWVFEIQSTQSDQRRPTFFHTALVLEPFGIALKSLFCLIQHFPFFFSFWRRKWFHLSLKMFHYFSSSIVNFKQSLRTLYDRLRIKKLNWCKKTS